MTQITWFARLILADGNPAANVPVQLQMFDLKAGWTGIADATTGDDGKVKGTAGEPGPAAGPAPMLRLMEMEVTPGILGGVPNVTATGSPPALTVDFGELTHVVERFSILRAAPRRFKFGTAEVAGMAMPAATRAPVAEAMAGRGASGDLGELQAKLQARDVDLTRIRAERDDTASQLAVRASALRDAQIERDDVRIKLTQRETDVRRLQTEREAAEAKLVETEKQLKDSRIEGTAAGRASTVKVGVLATRLGDEIDSAQTALKRRAFSLGSISVVTRGLVAEQGSEITYPSRDEIKTLPATAFTDVSFQYNPSPTVDDSNGVQVPDVRQLTESAARRVLTSVGLGLEVTQGPPSIDPNCAEGQVMLQSPRAGERAARGTRVIAIFARAEG